MPEFGDKFGVFRRKGPDSLSVVTLDKHCMTLIEGNSLKNLLHHIPSLPVIESASNSASVELVVTVFCLLAFQSIGPPNSIKTKPCEL